MPAITKKVHINVDVCAVKQRWPFQDVDNVFSSARAMVIFDVGK